MSGLNVHVHDGRTTLLPGEPVRGIIAWTLEQVPSGLVLELGWTTRGKGIADASVVDALRLENPGAEGQRDFELRLPDSPFSFAGALVSLRWHLRLAVVPGGPQVQVPLTVSPTGAEIRLQDQAR